MAFLIASVPYVAQAQTVYGILVDQSDSMSRPFPGTDIPIGRDLLQTVSQIVLETSPTGYMATSRPVLNTDPSYLLDASWLSFRTLGGVRETDSRQCDLSGYSSLVFAGNTCMLSDIGRAPQPSILNRMLYGPPSSGISTVWHRRFSDHSMLRQGLSDFVTQHVRVGANSVVKILFITDGGESCNREGRVVENNPSLTVQELLSGSIAPGNFYLTVLGFGVTDEVASNRLKQMTDRAKSMGAAYSKLVIANSSNYADALNTVTQETNIFRSEMQAILYNPCRSCDTTRKQACDCCYYTNFWRWNCPYPECFPDDPDPEWKCTRWETYQDQNANWVTVCMDGYWVLCPHPEHSATIYCGHFDHTCPPWVRAHGECGPDPHSGYNPCEFCSLAFPHHHNWFAGDISCQGVSCPVLGVQPHPIAPLDNIVKTTPPGGCPPAGLTGPPFPMSIN